MTRLYFSNALQSAPKSCNPFFRIVSSYLDLEPKAPHWKVEKVFQSHHPGQPQDFQWPTGTQRQLDALVFKPTFHRSWSASHSTMVPKHPFKAACVWCKHWTDRKMQKKKNVWNIVCVRRKMRRFKVQFWYPSVMSFHASKVFRTWLLVAQVSSLIFQATKNLAAQNSHL